MDIVQSKPYLILTKINLWATCLIHVDKPTLGLCDGLQIKCNYDMVTMVAESRAI